MANSGRNFLGRLNTGITRASKWQLQTKVLIDDFTQRVELFSSKEQCRQKRNIYIQKRTIWISTSLAVKEVPPDYQRSIVPYITIFYWQTGMRFESY